MESHLSLIDCNGLSGTGSDDLGSTGAKVFLISLAKVPKESGKKEKVALLKSMNFQSGIFEGF